MGKPYSNLAVGVAAASSIIFGYQLAALNSVSQFITLRYEACGDHFTYACEAAQAQEALASAAVVVGGTLGCFIAGPLVGKSRRLGFMLTQLLGIAGGVATLFARTYTQLALARVLAGLCVGFVCVVSPTWISEFSPTKCRGKNGVFHQLAIVIGIALANFTSKLLTPPPAFPTAEYQMSTWDRSVSMGLISYVAALYSAALLLAILLLLPDDSAQVYAARGDFERARLVLEKVNDTVEEAEETLSVLKEESEGADSGTEKGGSGGGFFQALSKPGYSACLIIGLILSAGQQLGGISAFVTQSSTIFREAGLTPATCVNMSIAMSVLNFVMTFPAMFLIDKFGRKPLLLAGVIGSAISLSLPLVFHMMGKEYGMAAVVAVMGYVACFAFSYGPVLWVYLFEMFPNDIKSSAAGLATGANWATNAVTVYLNRRFSNYVLTWFGIFATFSYVTVFFIISFMKETKGCAGCPYLERSGTKADEARPLFENNA